VNVPRGAALSLAAAAIVVTALAPAGPATATVIPGRYLTWYRAAARTCPGLTWEVLAGIGTMESDNGQSTARGVHSGKNRKGAEGPMQFEPATFAEYAVRADRGRGRKLSPYDPPDAIFTAARMLCADGAAGGSARGLRRAIFAYNHAHWYVRDVLAIAARYTAAASRGRYRAKGRRRLGGHDGHGHDGHGHRGHGHDGHGHRGHRARAGHRPRG
jgi:Transglycosylase SLT domain